MFLSCHGYLDGCEDENQKVETENKLRCYYLFMSVLSQTVCYTDKIHFKISELTFQNISSSLMLTQLLKNKKNSN